MERRSILAVCNKTLIHRAPLFHPQMSVLICVNAFSSSANAVFTLPFKCIIKFGCRCWQLATGKMLQRLSLMYIVHCKFRFYFEHKFYETKMDYRLQWSLCLFRNFNESPTTTAHTISFSVNAHGVPEEMKRINVTSQIPTDFYNTE